uniref:Nebulin n=1 Tax=Bubo bubo TaxID=30461 RepID=A0A8C0IFJ5_BUBBB
VIIFFLYSQVITEITETISTDFTGPQTTTYTIEHEKPTVEREKSITERKKPSVGDAAPPVRKRTIRTKVDPSKFLTPYLLHSNKMKDLFSENKYKEKFRKEKGKPYASTIDTPEMRRIKKVQDQLSEVKYRMAGEVARTICHVDEKAKDIEHAKKVSQQVSKVLYKQNWEETKDKYLLPPDAPELVNAIKNTAMFSKKLYTEDWEGDKTLFYPYNDSPELRRVAQAQKSLSDIVYKKGHDERKSKFTSLPDPPDVEQAKKVTRQLSDIIYHKDYKNNIKGKWSQTPCYDVAIAKMNADNISMRKYQEDFESIKDQIYFMQTETPEYEANKRVSNNVSKVKYRADYEKNKAIADYNVLPATENPLLRQLKAAGNVLSDKLYKEAYEQSKGTSMNYCDTPKFQTDTVLKNFSDVKYKDAYQKNILGHYLGSFEDPHHTHCMKVEAMKSDKNYKADYEEEKTQCYFPQTITQEYEAIKKLEQCKDHTYRKHPDQTKFTQVTDSPVQKQAEINSKQLSDVSKLRKHVRVGACTHTHTSTETFVCIHSSVLVEDHLEIRFFFSFSISCSCKFSVCMFVILFMSIFNVYKSKGEEIIHKYHLPPDVPQFIQAKVNAYNISDNYYKTGLEELKSKGYDLKSDAIPIRAAKAARQAASDVSTSLLKELFNSGEFTQTTFAIMFIKDVNYKKAYELAKGKLVGFKSLQDDPKLVHYMKVAKLQSEREYKKDYEKTKTKNNIPLDMVNVVGAKKAQEIASNANYKNLLHHYTYLPDAMNVELTKNMMEIQSDNAYKADYNNWMKGIGWIPIGSLEVEKAKKAGDALNEKKYRQHPDTIKFTSVVDSPVMVQAKQNSVQLNEKLYRSSGEEVKHKYTLTPDVPQFIQARYNAANISDAYYKQDYHDLIAKGNNVSLDAIPITRAKASRNIASDYKYKEAYEKAKGKQIGFRSLQDDPKLVHYMNVGKIQSEREYKKDYEKTKTNYHTPADMYSIQAAKQAQDVASNAHYKNLIHHYTYLPDAMDVELAKNMMQIQSDNAYKEEYNSWFKGIGWSPLGSLDVEKAKKAGDALNEKKYRQHPDTIKFTSIPDSIPMVLAQHNTKQLSDVTYKQEGEKVKHKYTLDPDVPQFIQARVNAFNLSDANYKADWKKTIAKGYDLKPDAIPIIAAKASRNIASDYKYKESYEKGKGKQVGYRSLQDDPKLVHYMNVAKMQSDREYRKDYEVTKTKYHTPLDMFSVTAAKKAQEAVTNAGYKQLIHHYTLLPDSVNLELSRNVMQIQSDNVYKADFNNWLRGVGWIPIQSLDVEKAKKASEILSEKKYRQHPDKLKYSITMDAMEQVLAKQNAKTMNKRLYTDKWNKEKTSIHVMPDTPEILQSRVNQITMSNKLYKAGWEEDKKKGYDMQPDAIPIKAAKASRDIASDYKYKLAYEKEKGKHIGFRSLEDDPKLVHFMQVAKMQSDREYKKDYEKAKTNFHTPVDMVSVVAAKKAQEVATNANYKNLIHNYNILPDAMSLELAKNMMQIQSDNQYRAEYDESMKGIGWMPLGSLEAEKNKKAMEIVSEKKYRQHPDKLKFSVPMDSMNMVLALNNAKIMDEHKYKQAWEEDKKKVHIMPDIPQIALAKANAFNLSDKMYRLSFEESRKKGYDLRADAIPIKAAKASRDIASDYKYKLGYEQDKGKLVGFRSLQDDPKLVHYMQVAKMQSDREYKKAYEMSKTHYQTPSDTLSIVAAKEAQDRVTNTNYKRLIHQYMLLPDAMSLELYRNMNQIQSDNEYKQDYNEWFRGIGWSPAGSLDVEKSKKATEIASDQKYRQHPSMFPFTKQNDAMDMVLAKQNANIMNKHAYTQAWEKDKTQVHVMPDTPDILQAKQNKTNYSQKLYKLGWEEMIKKGYDLTPEAISVKAAKASRDIASDYKYKEGYRKQQGHHIGFRSLQDDPKMLWSMQVAKMQSEREYKKDFEKWKTKFNMPVDMLGFLLAKKCQELVSDIDYKRTLHHWTCLPDQVDVTQAKRVYELQSDNLYKSDLQWLRGLGWSPLGSLESEKNKKASEILSEKKYRQHPDTIKFTSIPDAMDIILAKSNAKNRSDILYREAWDKDKTQVHIMPDTPEILLAKSNLINTSDKHYKLGYEELKRKGYDLPPDAIPLKSAKASRDIASEYQYKTAYRKQLGHHIGARNIEDDPKMMWSMHVAKIQSDREYKKAFEKTKTHFSSPVDMLGIVLAKKCQELVSDIDYKHPLHRWTCLPDQNDVVQAKKVYDLQSDNVYKSDLLWLRGIGWSPSGSLDDEKNKRASLILSDKKYRQHPDTIKFTSLPDSMLMVLAKHNSEIMNQRSYVSAWEKDKTSVHIMPDTPGILLAQQNRLNFSEKLYKLAMEEDKKKGYDMRADAIPIKAAKASRDIASDYKYKEGYRKQLGHHIGARNIEDDPKMMWSMHVAKIQSDREYKKAFEKTKTHFSSPVDMLGIVLAKKCQELVSDIDYKHPLHRWTCLPDQNDVVQAKKVYDLQSDNVYKSDLLWLRGIGWSPSGSLDDEKNKRASLILSDKKYRQHPDTIKFTSLPDSMLMVLAKHNSEIMNQRSYVSAWEKDKTSVHIMPDTPGILLAQQNRLNFSEKLYKLAMEEDKKKGYDMRADAIPIKAAKASRDIASDYKYKEGYRKQLGHHIGARNIEDDPKMMWSMHVAKIQSDREYKKAFEKTKTHFSSPVDMLGIVLAKKCQELVSDIDYKHPLHRWTCLPDQNDVVQAKKVYDLQSDNVYKSDLLWLRGIGWSPSGSLDDEKNKRASLILSDKKYRQHPDTIKFTSLPDSMLMVLAKHNSEIMNQRSYVSAWEKDKTSVHIMPDTPGILLAQQNRLNFSEKLYKLAMEEDKKKGYDMRADAIPIKAAKASRDIASDYKYKEGYRKQLGHHIGARNIEDDPKMMWSMHVAKIQSDREYKKAFEKTKTHFSSPVDMLGIVLAKKCQELVSDIDYRHYLHGWTCLPDQNDVIHAKKAYDLQSDNCYKSDLEWLRGIGWVPIGSLDVEKAKKAGEILSDKVYRQPPDTIKFTSVTDSLQMVLAKQNAETMNKRLYTEAWDKDKTQIHIMPDTPEITLAKQNMQNYSVKLYKQAMEEAKKKGYDLRSDAIPIQAAKASRQIASDYKYKEGYRKQLGHHIGARNIEDDPKMMWSMHVAKIQSDREYKKAFEKTKTHFSSPVDMLGIVLAKKCQELVSDIDYRHYLHQWICLPDQNDVIHAKKAYDLQSDAVYKSDLEWLRGIGWVPIGSMEVEKAKKAGEILSERKYRQPADQIKFTSVTDSLAMVLAKQNAEIMNKRLYTEAWDADKTSVHIMPDTPTILLAKANAANVSHKLYIQGWEEAKKKGYDMRADAIPIRSAKASRDIASDYKYKETHEKQKGHYIGCRTAQEDPKLSWAARAMLLQNDRIYRKAYHDSKAQVHIPVDAMSVQAAKECQTLVSDVDYRHYLHQWTCLPDQNDVIHARKAYDLQSDAIYKSDLEWLRGIGWLPNDSPDVKRVKHAQELLSDNVYRTPIESLKYTSVTDSPDVLLAKVNAEQVSIPKYKEAWEKDKIMIHITSDTPEFNLAKSNAVNYSQKMYKDAWDELKTSYDLRADAIPIKAAKASREIASDYKYKLEHEKQKGHYVGVPNAKADTKMKFALGIGKVQSELEYKKHFAKWKTQCHLPGDMLSVLAAKHGQSLVSDVDYRHYLHQWICLPDQNDVIQARKAYDLQSDAIYKSDLEWLRGIGWLPNDSVGINHVKHAGDLLNERKYRTKAETLPFTPVADRVDYITVKNSGEILSDIKYHKAWNEVKSNYTLTDTPQLDMAREAARILNQSLYKESWEKEKATGYLLPPDTVQICHAKRSNDVQSELKYKAEYVKQRGHYVGVASMRDDPKLVWFEHAGEIQNDRLYKSDYHKTKSKIHIPPDMVSVVAAKECQTLVSDIDYRQYLHEWTCHPDQNDCIQARKAYDLQSDNIYKSDLEWLRGCGWIPLDSVEHKKVKNAQELINKRAYTKEALDNFANYTSVVDTPDIVLAKINSVNQSDIKYKETFNLEKGFFIGSDDTPALNHAKDMSLLYSDKLYKKAWEVSKPIGYTLDEKYIPLVGAKRANYINSELKYKEIYEKLKGHYLAGKDIGDFPSVIHSLAFQKIRSALAYRKNYEDTKANVHIPSDMMNHVLAKKCQYILSDLEYRIYLHQWNCSPEENDVIQARKAQEILSDVVYKDDLNWLKGIGCYVWDTPQILHAKKSYDLQSQIKYTAAGKENLQNFGVVTDTPLYVTAVQSGINASDVKYKQEYHKTKDQYTTVTETVDSERVQNLKHLFSNNIYKKAWEKVKATGYIMPSDAVSLARAKELKHNASIVKYREEYDKFKALYTLPRGVEDDPNTARCLRVGKLNIDRLYREVYEKNKAKIHIIPDMVDIISAKDAQKKITEIDYRTHLHEWICLPDLQMNAHVRKVTDQVSDVIYKDDLNWLKGIGCFVWDTPEILHAKHAYDLRSDIKYKSKAEQMKNNYTVVMDTPVYVQNVLSGLNLSEAVYRGEYIHNVKGKMIPTDKTVDLERAYHANKIQSEVSNLYRWAGVNALPTGYSLPTDTPSFQHAKHVQYIGSDLKYKEAYEHMKAKGYTLGPKDVGFENVKKVNQAINERLYRATYHKYKDKIHTTPDTPEIRQVRATQEAVSDLIYKSDLFKMQGHLISLPYTPQVLHCRYVGDITSDNKYKEDLKWLRGLGCFLYDTPDMVRARHLRKLWSNYIYTDTAKKMWPKYNVVLDTPGYRAVQELKTHLSELVYRAAGKELKTKYTSILDTPDFLRAKQGQKIQSQYLYVELATKERPHHHAGGQTPAFTHARHIKDMVSEKKYKTQYEKMKDKYTPVPDTPVLIRAKRAYLNASDLRYKETFENTKGKYHTVKDALDIVYHRKVTDDISSVKYKENYMSQLGIWRSIPDRPEHYHHRAVTDAISDVKYKEDLSWLRGTGCYVWDTPGFALAEKNKVLYSGCKYKEIFEKTKSHFKYVADSPINKHFKYATQLMDGKLYKAAYEKLKDKYSVIVDDPRNLLAKWGTISDVSVVTPFQIIYKLEYNKAKPRGYTTIHDTPMLLHVRKVKDRISDLKYKEVYERNKSHCNVIADSVHIKTPRHAYKLNSNLDYKKKYEAAKAHWHWIADRPDFIQAAKSSLQQSDYEYKLDREFLKGCKLSVTDDKNTVLALNNAILASDIKYKEKHNKARGTYHVVPDTPQILLAKNVSSLVSENKYKEHSKKQLPHGSYTTLPETRDTAHVKEVTKNVSETNYKKKFVKEKGKSDYSIMLEPPEVKHAMEVAKKQSTIEYKKDAKSKLHYTPIADRPDIKKATQAAKLISDIEYKKRGEAGIGVTMLGRPDIELAKEVSKLTSQVKYKENFSKEMGKKPKYDLKEAKIYKTMKDAHNMASEVKYKADLKKLHKPVTDMSESLIMNHVLSTSQLASAYQYKKQYEKSKGHYHVVPDNLEQVHLREASELQSHVKYREKYEKEKGKPMLDFETPTYLTAKESQLMQSEKEYKKDFEESIKGRNLTGLEITPSLLHVKYATKIASEKEYRKDLEEGVRGKGLTALEETPDMLRAKNATQILNEKEYKKALELEIRGRGLTELALETPDFVRAKNATDIASQIKYKQLAEMEKANYTSVVDTPEIIHAQQVKNLSSQKKYKEDAERTMPYYVPVADTPEMQRVRENQKNFSTLQYQWDLQNSKGKVTVVQDTPEMLRVKENQKNFSSILYKEDIGTGTTIEKTPEMQRVKQTQDAISSIKYKESIGKGTPIPDLPEVKRVKETQKHISSVLYKEDLGTGTPTPVTPEIERVKRNQENFSSVLYKENVGKATPTPVTPEMERVKRNQEIISSVFLTVLYKENVGKVTPTPVTPEMERVKRNQEIISSVLYKENLGRATPTPITPEMERVKRNQEHISSVLYKEHLAKGTPTPMTPEMERAKRNQENISSVLYSDSFRKQVQGKAAYVLDTPEMRRVRETQKHISTVKYHEDFEKSKGSFTPVVTDPITERVKKNTQDFSDISYRGIQRRVVEMERKRVDQDQETLTGLRVWRTNAGSVFDYDPAEDNIQSRSLHMISVQAQRRSREHSRSASALSLSGGDEKSEPSDGVEQHLSYYSNGGCFTTTATVGYKHAKTIELPQQRSSSVATQQTTVSSVPSHPSTAGKTYQAMYDYMAADADEVSFKDGDTIVNVQAIDEGWMFGTVQRTGKTGMLPANYVEAV